MNRNDLIKLIEVLVYTFVLIFFLILIILTFKKSLKSTLIIESLTQGEIDTKNNEINAKKAKINTKTADNGILDSLINQDLISQINQLAQATKPEQTIRKIEAILKTRRNLAQNAAPLLLIEALMCELR